MKTGPFAEHSNQLWNISAVPSWSKVNQGLIRMYKAEVSGGRPAPSVPGLLLPAPPTPLFCPADTRGLRTSIRGLPVRKALDRGPLCPAAGGGGGGGKALPWLEEESPPLTDGRRSRPVLSPWGHRCEDALGKGFYSSEASSEVALFKLLCLVAGQVRAGV